MKKFILKNEIIITLIAVIAVLLLIFFFSSQTASESSQVSGFFANAIRKILFPDWKSKTAAEQERLLSVISSITRKAAHFLEFFLLGITLSLHFNAINRKKTIKLRYLFSFLLGVVFAAADEFHQFFVPGRANELFDVFVDSSGVFFGVLFVFLIIFFINRSRRKICTTK